MNPKQINFDRYVKTLERSLLQLAMLHCDGNKSAAAAWLGLGRTTFMAKLENINEAEFEPYSVLEVRCEIKLCEKHLELLRDLEKALSETKAMRQAKAIDAGGPGILCE